ncbi:hypothetical protein AVEN_108658-1 [Araneus ventricosus]|uniref:Uncharacterized protein n=1 Tax=Araneus ventricosus TaxID=182803 RepID=A0A4Y2PQ53_ARAVE|nr:hypothetical protein AVEN_108658-1 [Araneus ventricosus]
MVGKRKRSLEMGLDAHSISSLRKQRSIQHQSPSFNAFPVLAKKSCENPMAVILDNESEEGDAPAPIDMVDEQLECEDIEL